MKGNSLRRALLVSIVFLTVFLPHKSSAEWAYSFVVWDRYVYVLSDEKVELDQIDNEIGAVTLYSTDEGTYSGNFSNWYPSGTKYFSIKDISTDEAIAIEDSKGHYYKANREGEYASSASTDSLSEDSSPPVESSNVNFTLVIFLLALFPIIALGSYLIARRPHER
ncbi:hypothetical protein M9R32_15705 [Paenisporosarcina quisquiliarum]|uniref:Uncharacterized protein n=1 Tax=Paenisporosarcina quisquiliarum TaxID=365346 RepID=A0A9X3REF8_9BACL|nr:hypothetical protein [Paenisporosarcina quisquiliarum]MCZ8538621.1 hypothetical protein [Paenisporosarcina quisquiliarum]